MATRVADSRTRRYDPAETRLRVLEAANHLFSTQGFAKTGTADIARAADVSEGSIFYHFGSKRNLLEELGHMHGERMCEAMSGGDPLQDLTPAVTIKRCFDFCEANRSWEAIVKANGDGTKAGLMSNPDAEPFYRASHEVVAAWCRRQYAAMADKLGLSELDTEIAAELTYSAVGAALDIGFAPDATREVRERAEREAIRFITAACGVCGKPCGE